MVKSLRYLVFIISPLLSYQDSVAQTSPYSIEAVKDIFERQVTNVHQEKIFVHTDRVSYITGETIWLSAYCTDATFHVPIDLSKVLNIELLDPSGQAIKQTRIKLIDGLGKGQIFVSPDIQSGSYLLRAYTNWMKNFDPEFVFYKKIEIVNPSSVRDIDETPISNNQPDIDFFPEGGNLVSGLTSKVAVKASDRSGIGLAVTGVVYDHEDNEVAEFTTSNSGYAYFFLTPDPTKSYFARVELDGLIEKYHLPKVRQTGLVLSANTSETGSLTISIDYTKDFQEDLYLIVHTRGIIKKILSIDLKQETHIIKANELSEGISHITILSSDFTPLSERLVFKYPDISEPINLSIDQKAYNRREKVDLALELNENWHKDDSAFLSVSVSHSAVSSGHTGNIVSNLLLTSDLKGSIPTPWIYFDPNNRLRAEQLDLVMLTNGWRRFEWDTVKLMDNTQLKYPAEINAPILSGRVNKNKNGKLPISLQMNFLSRASVMNSHDLNAEGLFHFEVPFRINNEKVYFFVHRDTLPADQVSIISPFDIGYIDIGNFNNRFAPESRTYLETLNANIQISQVYRNTTHINGISAVIQQTNTPFYGTPDYLYNLDDYTRFETVADLFLEIIRTVAIRDNNKMSGFYVVNDGLLPGGALTLIDGVPIFDPDYVLNFDPLKIEKIAVINDEYSMGSIDYHGVIEFTTYQGDFDQQELPEYLVEKVYHGLQRARVFYAPNYSSDQGRLERIPDYRNTLYWNPLVKINGLSNVDLQFFTSDDIGLYQIEVNGITSKGQPIFLQSSFKVR